jgi:hypothetical protein
VTESALKAAKRAATQRKAAAEKSARAAIDKPPSSKPTSTRGIPDADGT